MCAIRLDEACDMNMDTGAVNAHQTRRRIGEGAAGRSWEREGINCRQTAQRICNVLWQLIMRATGLLRETRTEKVQVGWEERRSSRGGIGLAGKRSRKIDEAGGRRD